MDARLVGIVRCSLVGGFASVPCGMLPSFRRACVWVLREPNPRILGRILTWPHGCGLHALRVRCRAPAVLIARFSRFLSRPPAAAPTRPKARFSPSLNPIQSARGSCLRDGLRGLRRVFRRRSLGLPPMLSVPSYGALHDAVGSRPNHAARTILRAAASLATQTFVLSQTAPAVPFEVASRRAIYPVAPPVFQERRVAFSLLALAARHRASRRAVSSISAQTGSRRYADPLKTQHHAL